MQSSKFICVILTLVVCARAKYNVGVGIADCTGPPVEINFMGYANIAQRGQGIHLRQFSRAFIIKDGNKSIVFVSSDFGMMGHFVRMKVLSQLDKLFNGLYNADNVILSCTHTHSGPGGFLYNVLYDISCLGYSEESFNAYVNGIVEAIKRAHDNMVPARIYLSSGEVDGANINRSPTAYLNNPEKERKKYKKNTDTELTQLKFVSVRDDKPIGVINWFPVHPTSMNNTNTLVSSDNVGYASLLLEQDMNPGSLPGKGAFVSAFASTNLGDVSPNTNGARCIDTGLPCDANSSTCNGNTQKCVASGPGKDMFESTQIIGTKIYKVAKSLLNDNGVEINGSIKSAHQYVDMTKATAEFTNPNGSKTTVKGCKPSMGYSFAAGTTDGPGLFDFKQGTTTDNPFWNSVRDFLAPPLPEDVECHAPKPILLATGRMTLPYEWQPSIVNIQVATIGNVIITAVPGEFTTMSGRRFKAAVKAVAFSITKEENLSVIIAGLSNTYASYITTPEEYQVQRYEGASTIYGPHTLTLFTSLYEKLTTDILQNTPIDVGPLPEDFSDKLLSFISPVLLDLAPLGKSFGDCVLQPSNEVTHGDTVTVKFVSGNPRNNIMHEHTYLIVERQAADAWVQVASDANWETKFYWTRTFFASSEVTVFWHVGDNVLPGVYRIRHFGSAKRLFSGIQAYEGTCNSFIVVPKTQGRN